MINQKKPESFGEYRLYEFISRYCTDKEEVRAEPLDLDISSEGLRYIPDIYLPTGCKALDLKPKTIIEVRTRVNPDSLQQIIRISDTFRSLFSAEGYVFLCVFMEDRLHFLSESQFPLVGRFNKDFQVISFDDLEQRAPQKPLNVITPAKDSSRAESNLNKAKKAYLTEKCSVILGAGVSIDAELPKWDELLKRLIGIAKIKKGLSLDENDYSELFWNCGSSSIIMGRLVQTLFDNDKKLFEEAVKEALYEGRKKQPGTLAKKVCQFIKTNLNNITSVITYNYDDLIEQGLKEKKVDCEPVFGFESHGTYLPVCHVHGYLSQDENSPSTIVLSEREYHDIYRRSFHWSNVEQLHAMQRSTCFFIGLSMTDPNLRRLLDIAQGEQTDDSQLREIRHFAFLEKNSTAGNLVGNKADEFREKMEEMLNSLGVVVIWFDGYNKLPGILDKLMD